MYNCAVRVVKLLTVATLHVQVKLDYTSAYLIVGEVREEHC